MIVRYGLIHRQLCWLLKEKDKHRGTCEFAVILINKVSKTKVDRQTEVHVLGGSAVVHFIIILVVMLRHRSKYRSRHSRTHVSQQTDTVNRRQRSFQPCESHSFPVGGEHFDCADLKVSPHHRATNAQVGKYVVLCLHVETAFLRWNNWENKRREEREVGGGKHVWQLNGQRKADATLWTTSSRQQITTTVKPNAVYEIHFEK